VVHLDKIEIQFRNRRLAIDAANVVPTWVFGALFWAGISELILKRLYPNDFIKLQAAIIGADVVGDMPPGVAMVAVMYNTLYLVDVTEGVKLDIVKYGDAFLKFFGIPRGFPFPVEE